MVDTELKHDVYDWLEQQWPESYSLETIAEQFDAPEEDVRLALRSLYRDRIVSQDAEWDYRVVRPDTDT